MRLLLIRHGQTPSNIDGLLDTTIPGPSLTELGQSQAAALPEAIAHERVDAIYVSRMQRTQLTAAPLAAARGLEPQVRDGLHEISAGSLEMLNDSGSHESYMTTVFSWGFGELDVTMPGGPNGHDFFARFDTAIEQIAADSAEAGHETVVVVSHGAAIRLWASTRAHNLEPEFGSKNPLQNTGLVLLTGDPDSGWFAETWNSQPLAGPAFADSHDDDPTGELVEA
ncbi:histidine phosphatase family protein [soil metagenome]